jgi:hypothetical protein
MVKIDHPRVTKVFHRTMPMDEMEPGETAVFCGGAEPKLDTGILKQVDRLNEVGIILDGLADEHI